MPFHLDHPKPVIGLCGAPGAGKSQVAAAFADLGCVILDSDALARGALAEPAVVAQLLERWGAGVIQPCGLPDRPAIAHKVFGAPAERAWLESLIHPRVRAARLSGRAAAFANPKVPAVVEDCPLLFEVGIAPECDAVVFIDAPREIREARVLSTRHWTPDELARREAAQWPLDTKRKGADYVLANDADLEILKTRVGELFSGLLSSFSKSLSLACPH